MKYFISGSFNLRFETGSRRPDPTSKWIPSWYYTWTVREYSKKDPKRIKDPPSGPSGSSGSAISDRSGAEPYAFWSDLWKSPPGPRWQDRLERLGYTSNGASNVSVLSNSWKDVKLMSKDVKFCQISLFMSFMSFLFSFCLLCPWSRNLVLFKLNLQRTEQGSSGVDLSCLDNNLYCFPALELAECNEMPCIQYTSVYTTYFIIFHISLKSVGIRRVCDYVNIKFGRSRPHS